MADDDYDTESMTLTWDESLDIEVTCDGMSVYSGYPVEFMNAQYETVSTLVFEISSASLTDEEIAIKVELNAGGGGGW